MRRFLMIWLAIAAVGRLFRRVRKRKPEKLLLHRAPERSVGPKNGKLTLAVIGATVLMVVLGILNIRYLTASSGTAKVTGKIPADKSETICPTPGASSSPESAACAAPVRAKFYEELPAPELQACATPQSPQGKLTEAELQETPPAGDRHASKAVGKREDRSAKPQPPTPGKTTGRAAAGDERDAREYLVQVGAFAHPAIAREWSTKWRARGYNAFLSPVARPKTGVIYRLYLGKFTSEKEADDLVNRLKAKEGISAFRLVVQK